MRLGTDQLDDIIDRHQLYCGRDVEIQIIEDAYGEAGRKRSGDDVGILAEAPSSPAMRLSVLARG